MRQDGLIVNGRRHVDRYRQIVELSSDSIKKLDSEGAIVFINAGGIAALEAPNQEAVLGKRWPHLWPAVFRPTQRPAQIASVGDTMFEEEEFRYQYEPQMTSTTDALLEALALRRRFLADHPGHALDAGPLPAV